MNALKPDRNILIGAISIVVWSLAIAAYLVFMSETNAWAWVVIIASLVVACAAILDLFRCWRQYRRYQVHRNEFDAHIMLRNEIVAAFNQVKPKLREVYAECYSDDNGLDILADDGSPPFYCMLTTVEDEQYDAASGKVREIEVIRGYYIPERDCYAVQVEYDAITVERTYGWSSGEKWFVDSQDESWKRLPEYQASTDELRELLEHFQAV